jgi:hypothetical protein
MNRLILIVTALLASCASFAATSNSSADVAGTYILKLSEEAAALCRLLQTDLPQAKVVLSPDARYRYEGSFKGRPSTVEGKFAVRSNSLVLYGRTDKQAAFKGTYQQDVILLNGLTYERQSEPVCELSGTWVVTRNGQEDRSIRFSFKDDGTFKFAGMGGTSSGRYELDGNYVHLEYMEVDGQPAEFPMRGRAYLSSDRSTLRIDNYRYMRG